MDSSVHSHRRSTSSDHLIGLFTLSPPLDTGFGDGNGGGELHESEVFWTGDFSQSNPHHPVFKTGYQSHCFVDLNTSGTLAILPKVDDYQNQSLAERQILSPAIPRPPQIAREREYSQSVPCRNFNRSSPMNVPALSKPGNRKVLEVDDEGEEFEMFPPHETVSRGSGVLPRTTFSVLEGVGRTLKGRDLRQVRNGIWRKTGFLG